MQRLHSSLLFFRLSFKSPSCTRSTAGLHWMCDIVTSHSSCPVSPTGQVWPCLSQALQFHHPARRKTSLLFTGVPCKVRSAAARLLFNCWRGRQTKFGSLPPNRIGSSTMHVLADQKWRTVLSPSTHLAWWPPWGRRPSEAHVAPGRSQATASITSSDTPFTTTILDQVQSWAKIAAYH